MVAAPAPLIGAVGSVLLSGEHKSVFWRAFVRRARVQRYPITLCSQPHLEAVFDKTSGLCDNTSNV